ncbi:MAG: proline dehydrogenase [Bacteroidales bacterium]|nr:proline dehydrogenase [Bacteroidales bacterium]
MNFELTEIAYKNVGTNELKKKKFYVKLLRKDLLMRLGRHFIFILQKLRIPISWLFKSTIFVRFCGGETLLESAPVVEKLANSGVKSVLDYSVEAGSGVNDYDSVVAEVIRSIDNAAKNPNIDFAVFKPSGIADLSKLSKFNKVDEIENKRFGDNFRKIAKEAVKHNLFLMVDAEDYEYQDIVDEWTELIMEEMNKEKVIIFTTVQMYRTDRLEYIEKLFQKAREKKFYVGIKLVRGAYLEKERELAKKHSYPSPVFDTKQGTDDAFNAAQKLIIDNIDIAVLFSGTHNEYSNLYLTDLMKQNSLENNDKRVYFAQLFGMADHISMILAAEGYNVAKYVPYGKVSDVIPYMMRRIEENSSISEQSKREIELLSREIKRRKEKKI